LSFLAALKNEELVLLRRIVRKVHLSSVVAKHGVNFVTDHECDKLIESIGPEIVERMIKFGVDRGLN